jgi:ABC-type Fe3+ transport system substrate-binding protein
LLLTPPSVGSGRQLLSFSLGRGGNIRNTDAGFEFAKELAKAKMVGSIAKTDVEIVSAFTTGAVACGMVNLGNYAEIKKGRNVKLLNKVPDSAMFKYFVGYESITMLKRPGNRKPVKDFINFFLDASVNDGYAAALGTIPTNRMARVDSSLDPVRLLNEDERKSFGYYADHDYAAQQLSNWGRRWELEVLPFLT